MIKIENLKFRYSTSDKVNCDIDHLEIRQGSCIVLCGKSGSGKSTFTRLINGLIPNFYQGSISGSLDVNGLNSSNTLEQFAEKVSSVFQNPATQFFHRKVVDELVFSCENKCIEREEIRNRLNQTIDLLKIESLLEKDLSYCSGGEQQKVAIATALMQNPEIIVLDEPTANLDIEGIEMIKKCIEILKSLNITVIVAEHRLSYLREVADQYCYFEKGKLSRIFSVSDLSRMSDEERIKLGLRQLKQEKVQLKSTVDKKGLQLKNVILEYKDTYLGEIKDYIFNFNEVSGIVGKNGIGKTTLVNMISGLKKMNGSILLNDILLDKNRILKTSFVLQDVSLQLFSNQVDKEISFGLRKFEDKDTVIQKLNLNPLLKRHPMSLSSGEMQRVVIANSLLSNKEIFIFDEPTSGLDYDNMLQVSQLIKSLKSENHIVIVISHDYEFLNLCCDKIGELFNDF